MLIVCPSCASTYTIDAEKVGAAGRRVRCAACRTEWFVDATLFAMEPMGDIDGPYPMPGLVEDEPAWVATAVDERPVPPRPTQKPATQRRRPGLTRRLLAAPPRVLLRLARGLPTDVAIGLLALLAVASVLLGREGIVRRLPQTARLYDAVGLPVNLRGLQFRSITGELASDPAGSLLVVAGEVTNVSSRTREVPRIAVVARGPAGQSLYRWTAEPPRATLAPGETLLFRTRLASPPADASDVMVRFAEAGERVAGATRAR